MHRPRAETRALVLKPLGSATVAVLVVALLCATLPARAAPRVGSARSYRFALTDGAGRPARFNPCAPVRYLVNARKATPGARADVREAFRRLRRASGIRFRDVGRTRAYPASTWGRQDRHRWGQDFPPILVAFGSPKRFEGLRFGQAFGLGGNHARLNTRGRPVLVSGYVALHARRMNRLRPGFGAGGTRGMMIMHELGHVLGLAHVGDATQVMHEIIPQRSARWGAGDLAGLRLVGRRAGCLTPPGSR